MATNLATAYVQIQASTQGMGKQINRDLGGAADSAGDKAGKSSGKKFGGAFAGVVKKAGAIGAAVAVGLAAKGGVARALNIEDAQAKLKGLGNDSKTVSKIMDNALASVSGTSFGLGEAATTAAGAVAAGIKPGQDLERMLKSVANSAASAGVGMDEMGAIYNKVATSNKAQGDVLAQVNEKGIPLTATLAKQLGKTGAEVEKMASKGQIGFKEFEAAMTQASGTVAEEMGKTFRGSMANLSAAGSRIGATVMTPFLEMARVGANKLIPIIDGLNAKLKPIFENIGTGFTEMTKSFSDGESPKFDSKIVTAMAAVGAAVGKTVSEVQGGITAMKAAFADGGNDVTSSGLAGVFERIGLVARQVFDALGPVFTQIGAAIGPLIPQIIEFATSFSPISIIMQALLPVLPQIAAMLGTLGQAFGQIVAAVLPLAQTLMTAIVPVFTQLISTVLPVVIQLVTTLVSAFAPLVAQLVTALAPIFAQLATSVLPLLAEAFTSIMSAIMPVVNVILAILIPALQVLMPIVIGIVQGIVNNVIGAVQGIVKVITGVISLVGALFRGDWAQVWQSLKQIVSGAVQAVWNLIQLWFVGKMLKGITSVLGSIKGVFTNVWGAIKGFVSGVVRNIQTIVQGSMAVMRGVVQFAMGAIRNFFSAGWNAVKGIVTGGMSAIKNAVSTGISAVVNFFKALPGKIVSSLSSLAGKLGTVGRQMIQGMIDGIKGMAKNVIDSITGVAKGAIDGAKRLLGIHSPSRVFRDEVGKQISRGLAAGVTADQGKAVKAVEDLSKAVAKAGEKAVKQETANAKANRTKANAEITKHNKAMAKKRDAALAKADKLKTPKQRAAAKKAARAEFNANKKDKLPTLSKAEAERVAKRNIKTIQTAQSKAQQLLNAQAKTTAGIWEFGGVKGVQRLVNSLSKAGNWTRIATKQTRSATLADLAKAREVMADRIESANKRLDEMVDYRNQNAERIMGELDLKPTEDKDGKKKKLSIAEVSSRVKSLAAKAKQFASKLAALGKAGIPPGLIQEIAGYGTTEGIQVADAILSGTKKQQSNLAKDWQGLESASKLFGTVAAEEFFGVGIAAQQGIIKGLESDDKKLKKAAENLASKLTKATRKALGIHSPSRVFRDQVGAYIPAGVIAGIDQGQGALDNRVAGMVHTTPPATQTLATAPAVAGAMPGDGFTVQGPLVAVERMVVDSDRRVKQLAQELHTRGARTARAQGQTRMAGVTR
ncbi:phage tail protein [Glutamicibacter soli]